jgi:hypothetical protein
MQITKSVTQQKSLSALKGPKAVKNKFIVFWDVTSCSMADEYGRFGGTCHLHLKSWRWNLKSNVVTRQRHSTSASVQLVRTVKERKQHSMHPLLFIDPVTDTFLFCISPSLPSKKLSGQMGSQRSPAEYHGGPSCGSRKELSAISIHICLCYK